MAIDRPEPACFIRSTSTDREEKGGTGGGGGGGGSGVSTQPAVVVSAATCDCTAAHREAFAVAPGDCCTRSPLLLKEAKRHDYATRANGKPRAATLVDNRRAFYNALNFLTYHTTGSLSLLHVRACCRLGQVSARLWLLLLCVRVVAASGGPTPICINLWARTVFKYVPLWRCVALLHSSRS